jgi:N-acetylglucosamine repressor
MILLVMKRGLSHTDNAERNKKVLLNIIREKGPLSRVEAARVSQLSIATTKRLVDELISSGMVAEGAAGERAGRGRRAASLALDGRHGFAVGVNLEPGALEVEGLSFTGERIYRRHLRPPAGSREAMEGLIADEAGKAAEACASGSRGPLLGVGVGIAGLVDARAGVVLYCPGLPGWEGVELGASLREALGTEILVDDGVRCMALAEKRYGAARELDTFLQIYIGSGVGSGIVLDNRIYRGRHGVSGEFGHITVREAGPLCTCGNRGCLEAIASSGAVLSRVTDSLSASVHSSLREAAADGALGLADVYRAAAAEDRLANLVIEETEESIGIGIANLINVFDPGTVILSGEVVRNFQGLMLEGIRKTVRRRALAAIAHRTAILTSAFPADAAAMGAATMVLERVLESEILNL